MIAIAPGRGVSECSNIIRFPKLSWYAFMHPASSSRLRTTYPMVGGRWTQTRSNTAWAAITWMRLRGSVLLDVLHPPQRPRPQLSSPLATITRSRQGVGGEMREQKWCSPTLSSRALCATTNRISGNLIERSRSTTLNSSSPTRIRAIVIV